MKLIVIGADAAGMSAASQVRRLEPQWLIEAFDEGNYSSYGLCGLPYFISGLFEPVERLIAITPEQFEKTRGIKVHLRHRVTAINPSRKNIEVVELASGQARTENYDYLMIATGAAPIMPPGLNPQGLEGVFYLRGLDDGLAIKEFIKSKPVRTAAVIGAGYIGLEMIEALTMNDLRVTLIGDKPAPLFEPEIRDLTAKELARSGVVFMEGRRALSLRQTPEGQVAIETEPAAEVVVDMVVVGVGVRPRSELAEAAGLALGAKKAIRVDRRQRTSDPLIYAGGDCAEAWHALTKSNTYIPLALTANRQGRVAGRNIAGLNEQFPGVMGTGVLKFFSLGLARTGLGLDEARGLGFENAVKEVVRQPSKPGYYPGGGQMLVEVIFDRQTGRLLGGQLAGPVEGVGQRINTLVAALTAGLTVKQVSQFDTAYAPPFSPVYDPVVIACEVAAKKKHK